MGFLEELMARSGMGTQQPDQGDMPPQSPASPDMGGDSPLTSYNQQASVPAQKTGRIKSMLTNFAAGMGDAMRVSAGLDSSAEAQTRQATNAHTAALTQLTQQQVEASKSGMQMIDTPLGQMPQNTWKALAPAFIRGQSQRDVQGLKNEGGLDVQGLKNEGALDVQGAKGAASPTGKIDPVIYAQIGAAPDPKTDPKGAKMWGLAAEAIKTRMASAPRIAMSDENARNTPYATFDANGGFAMSNKLAASRQGLPDAKAFQSLYGPTSATKTAGQAAGAVAGHIPEFKQSIEALDAKGELGPVMGRINEYVNKGYGGDDPAIAAFVANVKLLKSGTVRAHFGARGGQQVLASFDDMINTAQTKGALTGAVDAIDKWLSTYGDIGTLKGPKTGIKSGGGGGNNDPLGIRK